MTPVEIVAVAILGAFVLVHLSTAGFLWAYLRATGAEFGAREAYRETYRQTGLAFVAAGMPIVAYAFVVLEQARAAAGDDLNRGETV